MRVRAGDNNIVRVKQMRSPARQGAFESRPIAGGAVCETQQVQGQKSQDQRAGFEPGPNGSERPPLAPHAGGEEPNLQWRRGEPRTSLLQVNDAALQSNHDGFSPVSNAEFGANVLQVIPGRVFSDV
jgi:hypothetical protein